MTVLDRLPGPPWNAERAAEHAAARRLSSLLRLAKQGHSVVLLRRILNFETEAAGDAGRRMMAVAFEFTMNWGLLPDPELLEVARRLDGPALEPIWQFALPRTDAPGVRARWLWEQLEKSVAVLSARAAPDVGRTAVPSWLRLSPADDGLP